ncbi:hypothetical protein BURK1_01227 [Burkholderiales bacterium]|nr:hypothetical protein BURK1_01227 [Burkholderiales bacterium]
MVRNEADIIEAFVRHNLSVLDGMAVIDHGSVDGTLAILRRLGAERLPLVLFENDMPGYLQEQITTSAVRRVLSQFGADFVFALDADEFLKVPERDGLDRALLAIPPRMHGVLRWLTYVPSFDPAPRDIVGLLRGARRLAVERHIFHKVVVSRHLMATPDATLSNGNHFVAPHPDATPENSGPHARVRDAFAAIAHVPIRSGAQLVAKVAIKKLGRMAANMDWNPDAASQFVYGTIRSGRALDAATLLEYAVNWSVVRDKWLPASSVELVDDPFLAPIALKYTPQGAADPLPLVLAATERIARRFASGAAAPSPRPAGVPAP